MMKWNPLNIVKALEGTNALRLLSRANHGIERETLRTDHQGNLALTPHPKTLSDPLTDNHITLDFSESQLELITRPHDSIEKALHELKSIHQNVALSLKNEWMWPFSMPCILPEEDKIPLAHFGESDEGRRRLIYRRGLASRYGKYMQMLCGIHYNVSFSDELWQALHSLFGERQSLQEFKNEKNIHLVRNFIRHRWILAYLTGASPVKHQSYGCKGLNPLDHKNAVSLRLSRCGYDNSAKININYNQFENHLNSIQKAVDTPYEPYRKIGIFQADEQIQLNDHLLQIANEYYFPIRLKPKPHSGGFLEGLKSTGVEYAEVRMLDVNPLKPEGIAARELRLTHLFILHCLLSEDQPINEKEIKEGSDKQQFIAINGRQMLPKNYREEGGKILDQLKKLSANFDKDYQKTIDEFIQEFNQPANLIWKKIIDEMESKNQGYIDYGLTLAKRHFNELNQ